MKAKCGEACKSVCMHLATHVCILGTYCMQVQNIPFTVNTPELLILPIILLASQVYLPTSDDSAFIILRVLSITDSFRYIDELLYL